MFVEMRAYQGCPMSGEELVHIKDPSQLMKLAGLPPTLGFGGIALDYNFEGIVLTKRGNRFGSLPGSVSVGEYELVVGEDVDEGGCPLDEPETGLGAGASRSAEAGE